MMVTTKINATELSMIPKFGKSLKMSRSNLDIIPRTSPITENIAATKAAAAYLTKACPPLLYVSRTLADKEATEMIPKIVDIIPFSGCLLSVNMYLSLTGSNFLILDFKVFINFI